MPVVTLINSPDLTRILAKPPRVIALEALARADSQRIAYYFKKVQLLHIIYRPEERRSVILKNSAFMKPNGHTASFLDTTPL